MAKKKAQPKKSNPKQSADKKPDSTKKASAPKSRPSIKKGGATASEKAAAAKKAFRDKFVPVPELPEKPTIRVIPASPDVLFARAQYALQELKQQIDEDARIDFVDVGYKLTGGDRQNDLALRVHVKEKSNINPLPKSCCYGRIRTDVIPSRFIQAVSEIDSGDGVRSDGGVGTLSMGVKMPGVNEDVQWMLMTCAHVITNGTPVTDTLVFNTAGDEIGALLDSSSRFFELNEKVDVAIFSSIPDIPASQRGRFDQFPVRPRTIANPTEDDVEKRVRVYKFGNNTKCTIGVIDSRKPLYRDIPIDYDNGSSILTHDHFLIASVDPTEPFAQRGDSGAAVVTEDGRLIGIVRGVTRNPSDPQFAVVTPMARIAARFGFGVASE